MITFPLSLFLVIYGALLLPFFFVSFFNVMGLLRSSEGGGVGKALVLGFVGLCLVVFAMTALALEGIDWSASLPLGTFGPQAL